MKASRYSSFVRCQDVVYGVNLLSRSVIEFSPEAHAIYEELAQGCTLGDGDDGAKFIDDLRSGLFLVEDDFDEIAYLRLRVHQERFSNRDLGLVIVPTLDCNFSCHYCFEAKRDQSLSPATCDGLLRLIAPRLAGRRHLGVQWFGGEPLLALATIEKLSVGMLLLTEECNVSYDATVVTNGLLLT